MKRLAALALLLAAACSGAKGKAQTAITAAEQAVAAVPADAAKVIPDELAALNTSLQSAKDQLANSDYEAAIGTANDAVAKAGELITSLPAKKAALSATLDTLAVAMPRNLGAIKAKLDQLGRSRQLPRGIDAQQVQAAKDTYTAASEEWAAVMADYRAGDLGKAMAAAVSLKTRVSQSLQALGLVSDERAWSNVTLPPK
jgi:hypothetical protein